MAGQREFGQDLRQRVRLALRYSSSDDDPLLDDKEAYVRGLVRPPEMAERVLEVLGEGSTRDFGEDAYRRLFSEILFDMRSYAKDRVELANEESDVGSVGAFAVELSWVDPDRYPELRFEEPGVALRLVCESCHAHIPEPGDGHVMILMEPPRRLHVTHHKFCYPAFAGETLRERSLAMGYAIPSEDQILELRAMRYDGIVDAPWGMNMALPAFLRRVGFLEGRWR